MQNRLSRISKHKLTIYFSAACLLISSALVLLSRYAEGFAQWYAVTIYPVFPNLIGRTFTIWKYSWFETGILSIAVISGVLVLTGLLLAAMRSSIFKTYRSVCLRVLICFMAGLLLIYSLTCSVNYQRDGIGTVLNLPRENASTDRLEKLNLILARQLTELTDDPDWDYSLLTVDDMAYIETEAVNSMKLLGKKEPSLSGYYPDPKPIYFTDAMASLGIDGIFSPFTMEANYNGDMTPFLIPYTICHELAHLKGYMKEDDASFIGYLACKNSPSMVFQYSGIFHALIYTLNALKTEVPTEEFNRIYKNIPEPVRIQLNYVREQSQLNETAFTSLAGTINNTYLKANAQSGTESYGQIVDLLLADYADQIDDEDLL